MSDEIKELAPDHIVLTGDDMKEWVLLKRRQRKQQIRSDIGYLVPDLEDWRSAKEFIARIENVIESHKKKISTEQSYIDRISIYLDELRTMQYNEEKEKK